MKIAIVGCGVMGSSFARYLGKNKHHLLLCDRNVKKAQNLAKELKGHSYSDITKAMEDAEIVLLAIKPKDLTTLSNIGKKVSGKIILSILAGTEIDRLSELFPDCEIVKAMPNLAIEVQESVIGLSDENLIKKQTKDKVEKLLKGLGLLLWIPQKQMDAVSALAGSGPAFVITIIEAMVESGILMGLSASDALNLSLQTILGSVALVKNIEGHPGEIRWRICSPGGTTIAGVKALEDAALRSAVIDTFLATYEKNKRI